MATTARPGPQLPPAPRRPTSPSQGEDKDLMISVIHRIIEGISIFLSAIGVIVVLWGAVESSAAFLRSKIAGEERKRLSERADIRIGLGSHLLLGLEIFIAADIVSSVASPTWNKVGMLGAIVGIRTVLSYFLTQELKGCL